LVEITWSDYSDENSQDIFDFIAKDSFFYANKQLEKFIERVEILRKFPLAGRIVPEFEIDSVRELIEGSYRIIYEIVSEESIWIVTIQHHSRLLK
jgi:toxin ParE1/3/4